MNTQQADLDDLTPRPCPFCAHTGTYIESYRVAAKGSHVEYNLVCQNCGAQGPNDMSRSQAIKMWNMRRETAAEVEKLKAARGD